MSFKVTHGDSLHNGVRLYNKKAKADNTNEIIENLFIASILKPSWTITTTTSGHIQQSKRSRPRS